MRKIVGKENIIDYNDFGGEIIENGEWIIDVNIVS